MQRWKTILGRFTSRIRNYRGVAGIIRRQMVFAISIALILEFTLFLSVIILRDQGIFDLIETIALVSFLFLLGLLFNGWLILRLTRRPLQAIEGVEKTLVNIIESGQIRQEHISALDRLASTPFLGAFNSLLKHVDALESHHLEFLSKVAHEIRSPIATILGYTELLANQDHRPDERFTDEWYQVIRRQGTQVCMLVEKAVLAAELDAGHNHFQFTEFELGQFLGILVEECRKKSGRSIQFIHPTGEIRVSGDLLNLREAVLNLIDNALKFSNPASPVVVGMHASDKLGWVEISVQDEGIGIDDKDISNLFRRFSRIRSEYTQHIPGNGLGLYIANRIVQNHKGGITVASKLHQGSIFTIHLPRQGMPDPSLIAEVS